MAEHGIRLENSVVSLRPLEPADATDLLGAAGSPETFRYFSRPPTPWSEAGMAGYCRFLADHPTIFPFCVRDARTGQPLGSTTYCDLRPDHRAVEIGWTWYAPSARGTPVNPACKRLMLDHAFSGALFGSPALRVTLKTDARNVHSQRAIARLGATREGTLRSHVLMPDGHRRDTVYFSILDHEWPAVRARLDERLSSAET